MAITSPLDIPGCMVYINPNLSAFSDDGVTPAAVGDTVQRCNDQTAHGNNVSQASASRRPILALIAGVKALLHDGIDDFMDTPDMMDASYNTSITIMVVYESASNVINVALSNVGAPNGLYLYNTTTSSVSLSGAQATIGGLTVPNGEISQRVQIFRWNGSLKTLRSVGPDNDVVVSASDTGDLNLSGAMRLGGLVSGSGSLKGPIFSIAVWNNSISDAHEDDLAVWAINSLMQTPAGSLSNGVGNIKVVQDGDSLTKGMGTKLGTLLGAGYTASNVGVNAQTLSSMKFDAETEVDILWSAAASRNVCIYFEEINEHTDAGPNVEKNREYGRRRRYKGWETITCTGTAWNNTAGEETKRLAHNASLRSAFLIPTSNPYIFLRTAGVRELIIDLAVHPSFTDFNNSEWYLPDLTHWTSAGSDIAAGLMRDAIVISGLIGIERTYNPTISTGRLLNLIRQRR